MKIVIQKVKEAKVLVDDLIKAEIKQGFVLFVGIEKEDSMVDINKAADKISKMRLFEDEAGKTNLSLNDVGGEILSISQFTLAADVRKGNRPSFINAMDPETANDLFNSFNQSLEDQSIKVSTGIFQAHMNVILDNDGPMTIVMQVKDGKVL